ncbi:MAG: phosphoribosyltransferase family protein [Elusimicrobiota bacterium]
MDRQFESRSEAGRQLAARLDSWMELNPVVIGLTRGGVSVAAEVAGRLRADLDALVVRKLASPGDPEMAIGAIAEGGSVWLVPGAERAVDTTWIRGEIKRQEGELHRRMALLRPAIAPLQVSNRVVIVVDDGVATGATVSAAVLALRVRGASSVIVAAPVASREAARTLAKSADAVVFLIEPEDFMAVGQWYVDFSPVPDEDVLALLREARRNIAA